MKQGGKRQKASLGCGKDDTERREMTGWGRVTERWKRGAEGGRERRRVTREKEERTGRRTERKDERGKEQK